MTTAALDTTKLLILMLAGGAFAAAGLWLMLRPRPESGAAKIELFGMKFEAASAGLLVFLTGAGFMTVPVFVPEREGARPLANVPVAPPAASGSENPSVEAAVLATEGGRSAPTPLPSGVVPPRQRASGSEVEPNDDYESANQIAVGGSVKGVINAKTEDWFVIPVDPAATTLHLRLRNLQGSFCRIYFYSASEQELRIDDNFPKLHTVKRWEVTLDGSGGVFLRLQADSWDCRYELFTSYTNA